MPSLPPKTPETKEALVRAITLLGHRSKGNLKKSLRLELIELVGAYPDPSVATEWKSVLKPLRDDEAYG